MGRATQSCRAAGVFAGEIISPPNRQEAHAVGVGGGGFQNTTNRYSPLSNDTAALPVPVSVGTSSASHPERAGDIHICPQGAWTGGDGSSGTSCSLFWGLRWGENIGTLYEASLVQAKFTPVQWVWKTSWLWSAQLLPTNYTSLSELPRRQIKDCILGAFLNAVSITCQQHAQGHPSPSAPRQCWRQWASGTACLVTPSAVPGEPSPPSSWETSSGM